MTKKIGRNYLSKCFKASQPKNALTQQFSHDAVKYFVFNTFMNSLMCNYEGATADGDGAPSV